MVPALKPVDRPAGLGDRVYRRLRESLGSHAIVPGQRLQEAALAVQLGVSRTPVREALARLESEGLIAADGRSFTVPVLTDTDVDEIYELRELLEPAALAQVAAEGVAPGALSRLGAALASAEAAEEGADAEAFIEANARFHAGWHDLVANRRLLRALDLYAGHVRYLRVLTLNHPAARKAALAGMRKIHAVLKKRDRERAVLVMREHLKAARHHLRLVLDDIDRDRTSRSEPPAAARARRA
ncbi:MAG: GntR family transcriptional regulator [Burkholderiales bacterium]|jgi:DNA-binding GntR family transcriptional regulator|nr:GntR family transcriptional regulator [Burkholderiales bacterium]